MLILYHAKIRTQDDENPTASAIAIEDGKIFAVGSDEDVLALSKQGDQLEDLNGHTIWPGLTDSHIHIQHLAANLQSLRCEDLSKENCVQLVAEKASEDNPGKWILGHGWDHNNWPGGYGSVVDLDNVSAENPVYLTSKSLHSAWVNSKALEIAGINRNTPDPTGGVIIRSSDGLPSGILLDNAIKLVKQVIPNPTKDELAQDILKVQQDLNRAGLTSIHDFDRYLDFEAFQILRSNDKLKLRIEMSIALDDLHLYQAEIMDHGRGDATIHIGNLKLFADGALGSRTAAMFDPYEGLQDEKGLLIRTIEELIEFGKIEWLPGLSIHAIGDYANHIVLNAIGEIRKWEKSNAIDTRLHRIEHAQLVHSDDFKRFADLNVIASMQPIHATSDQWMAEKHWGTRCKNAYAWKKILESKVKMIFGSDSPVESFSPFWGMEAAITRKRWYPPVSESAWYYENAISLKDALDAYTIIPAQAAGHPGMLGKLAPGYFADLIVLHEDPFFEVPERLHTTTPLATMFNGEWVFKANDW